jgi:hypothetical protein
MARYKKLSQIVEALHGHLVDFFGAPFYGYMMQAVAQ